jgi:hypothetical protein
VDSAFASGSPFASVAMTSAFADSTLSHHPRATLWLALIETPPARSCADDFELHGSTHFEQRRTLAAGEF